MIIVLNGPPGCGKDTIAQRMAEASPVFSLASMKEPMWDIARAVLGSDNYHRFLSLYDNRKTKEQVFDFLGGLSPRGFMIHISEIWCKPLFSDQYFGKRMLHRVKELSPKEVVISDGGFPSELIPVLEAQQTVLLVRLRREGYTFDGDSRNYIQDGDLQNGHLWSIDYTLVDGEVDKAVEDIIGAYQSLAKVLSL